MEKAVTRNARRNTDPHTQGNPIKNNDTGARDDSFLGRILRNTDAPPGRLRRPGPGPAGRLSARYARPAGDARRSLRSHTRAPLGRSPLGRPEVRRSRTALSCQVLKSKATWLANADRSRRIQTPGLTGWLKSVGWLARPRHTPTNLTNQTGPPGSRPMLFGPLRGQRRQLGAHALKQNASLCVRSAQGASHVRRRTSHNAAFCYVRRVRGCEDLPRPPANPRGAPDWRQLATTPPLAPRPPRGPGALGGAPLLRGGILRRWHAQCMARWVLKRRPPIAPCTGHAHRTMPPRAPRRRGRRPIRKGNNLRCARRARACTPKENIWRCAKRARAGDARR